MKKAVSLLALFGIAFVLTIGLVAVSANSVEAEIPCVQCIYEFHCTSETGELCPNPTFPYYAYAINGSCWDPGHPNRVCPDKFAGCCRFPGL